MYLCHAMQGKGEWCGVLGHKKAPRRSAAPGSLAIGIDLSVGLPQAMQVAVSIRCDRLVAVNQGKDSLRRIAGVEVLALDAVLGLQDDESDAVLFLHRVGRPRRPRP